MGNLTNFFQERQMLRGFARGGGEGKMGTLGSVDIHISGKILRFFVKKRMKGNKRPHFMPCQSGLTDADFD